MISRRIRIRGIVQGVGFRPFVYRAAMETGVTGSVANDPSGVHMQVHGEGPAIDAFIRRLDSPPPMARIDEIVVETISSPVRFPDTFTISESSDHGGRTTIPPDTAVCPQCLQEMADPNDRRYRYPFIACTDCGPRFTITTGLPYDREHTTMVDFPLCAECRIDYEDPGGRRYHAQPTACPQCGPQITGGLERLREAASELTSGLIVAIKGVGGYHLACNARDADAVATLRRRKARGPKPFAVMARDVSIAHSIVDIDDLETSTLQSPGAPIVVGTARDEQLHRSVAPGNGSIGVMLPYAPIHHLLFEFGAPEVLVMTSGNLSDEPICINSVEAELRLSGLADSFVHHDRRIHLPCDDSVIRFIEHVPQPIRQSRGSAPTSLPLPVPGSHCVAVGGELKATACVSDGEYAWISQHIGDTSSLETLDVLESTITTLVDIERITPRSIISDLHPGYLSAQWASRFARERGIDHFGVQHHHAHMASLLVEHEVDPVTPVLAIALDGTGYGLDGTIWGGEILVGGYREAVRCAHLAPVLLPGGDAATKHPDRIAASYLLASDLTWNEDIPSIGALGRNHALLRAMLTKGTSCVPTSSAGRLFDAASSLLGICHEVQYEGQAAIELEAVALASEPVVLPEPAIIDAGEGWQLDSSPLIRGLVEALRAGHPVAGIAHGFHQALAAGLTRCAVLVREQTGVTTAGLTGGVFANRVLTSYLQGNLVQEGFGVLTHRVVPPNDGGLALGQVAVAAGGGALRWRSG